MSYTCTQSFVSQGGKEYNQGEKINPNEYWGLEHADQLNFENDDDPKQEPHAAGN